MRRWGLRRVAVGAAVLALLAAGCSGNRSAQHKPAASAGQLSAGGQGQGATTTVASTPGTAVPAGAPAAAVAARGPSGRGGAPAGSGPNVAGTHQSTSGGFSYTAANLFAPDQDRIGITDTSLSLCIHAPLIFGPIFQDSASDFQVYWHWLNDHGGIYGRKVNMTFTDDQYTPQGGVQAAQQCQQSNPFLMAAGVGFDTVPAVRQWAEQNKLLYLASFATENGLYNLSYSFEIPPSVEHFGEVAGNYVGAKYPGKVGVVWRNSPNWQGGRDHFEAAVKAHGSKVVADIPVQENQGDYTSAILNLETAGAQTVLAWMNVVEFTQFEKQAAAQGYHPRWVTAAFNLVTDTLGHDIDGSSGPAAVGLWVTPEFHLGDTTSPWSGEERAMEAVYAQYDSGHKVTDTDWQVWLAFKQLGQLLNDCGKDCTRNKLAGMFIGGYKAQLAPLCPVDFSRGKGKLGSFAMNVSEAINRNGSVGWNQVATCAETF